MKSIKYLLSVAIAIICLSCNEQGGDPINVCCNSVATYAKNTLNYSISIQCFYQPLNGEQLWCEQEPIAWSEPIEIQPGERMQVMDFVRPYRIKIFRTSDGKLLSDAYGFAEPTVEHILLPQEELPNGWVLRLSEKMQKRLEFLCLIK
ncbi:MAG: hypothetical protein KBA02_06045 [Paludibacteraceae bacterium]|jgi:hypothetical protein|nr:hypothetical protein [Paludibacteraceae bacterium]OQA47698.1 MAG: hypothetical protein BWY47_01375 [Bacteroidetes bacterium ADurb.Bin302]HOH96004.1 hypothetical protein [Candidatus Enterocola sp.]HPG54825.1 hypothetical protein [Candidatus Enterocola sp.]